MKTSIGSHLLRKTSNTSQSKRLHWLIYTVHCIFVQKGFIDGFLHRTPLFFCLSQNIPPLVSYSVDTARCTETLAGFSTPYPCCLRVWLIALFGLLGSGGCGHDLRGRALGDGGTRRLLHVAWGVHGRLPALQDRGRGRCYVPACRGCGKNYSDVRCCKNYSAVRCCKNYSAVRCCKNCCRCFVVVLLFILVLRAVLSFPKFLDVIPKNMPFLSMTWLVYMPCNSYRL